MGLTSARLAHVFRVRHIPLLGGSRGKPVPLLYTDRPLDPAARLFAEADPVWNWTAKWLTDRIPACPELAEGRSVTLTRVPHYRPHAPRRLYDDRAHPEAHDVDGLDVLKRRKRLPPPEPDPVWYKWSRETKDHEPHFLGDDPSNWRKGPNDYGHRPPRFLTKRKSPPRVRPSTSSGSEHFNGHHWLCPACGKRCRTIFLPLPPVNLLAREQPRLAQIVDIPRRLDGFACVRCHRVRYFSRIDRNGWNGFIAYISGGLLYGHEVPRPTSIPRDRKRRYRPCLNRAPSARRAQVLERLLKGMTYDEIAADLRVGYATVHGHVKLLYKQHAVHSARELAAKLRVQLPPRVRARKQAEVARRLALGQTPSQIARETRLTICAVRHHVKAVRRTQRPHANAT